MKKNIHKFGFTLVETLVAIAILVLVITGAMTAAQSGISSDIFSKDQITAFYLAQEAVEQIRNIRDENGLNSSFWLSGIAETSNDPCYFDHACTVDAVNTSVTHGLSACTGEIGSCPILREDPTSGFYGYTNTWDPTIFKREIKLTQIDAKEVAILVSITWSKGLVTRQFKVHENIFNWQ